MDTFAFATAAQLRSALTDGVLTSADVLTVLQTRKERKEASGQALKGKSLALMNSLLGIPAPAKAAKAEPRVAEVGESEAYAAKLTLRTDKQLAQQAAKAYLPWKKAALAAEIASRDASPALTPDSDRIATIPELEAMLANIERMRAEFAAL
jgi:hypothetical protein